jgi:uridine kinase
MTAAEAIRAACAIIESAARAIPNDQGADAPLIVGIDGAGGAGKSTLARGIDDANPGRVSIVRCDDFYHPLTGAQYSWMTAEEAYENYFDWRRLRDEALIPLRRGERAPYRRYDWSTDSLADWIQVEPREIVLVEGVFSMRPELRPLIDVAIFIETPREERQRRMLARPQDSTAWIDRWTAAEDWYLEHIAPNRNADLVVEGF